MAYVNVLYLRDLGLGDIKPLGELCSGSTLVMDTDVLWKAWITNSGNIDMQLSTLPTSLGKLCEFTTVSTTLLLLFFNLIFIRIGKEKIIAEKVGLE